MRDLVRAQNSWLIWLPEVFFLSQVAQKPWAKCMNHHWHITFLESTKKHLPWHWHTPHVHHGTSAPSPSQSWWPCLLSSSRTCPPWTLKPLQQIRCKDALQKPFNGVKSIARKHGEFLLIIGGWLLSSHIKIYYIIMLYVSDTHFLKDPQLECLMLCKLGWSNKILRQARSTSH